MLSADKLYLSVLKQRSKENEQVLLQPNEPAL